MFQRLQYTLWVNVEFYNVPVGGMYIYHDLIEFMPSSSSLLFVCLLFPLCLGIHNNK